MALKKFKGSCRCGKIFFEAEIDLSQGTGRCNCTICSKMRFWGARIKPDAFTLLSGGEFLGDYGRDFGAAGNVHHYFCKQCGIHPYGAGDLPHVMGKYVSVNLGCLDNVTDAELAAAPIRYMNGREDKWTEEPKVTSFL